MVTAKVVLYRSKILKRDGRHPIMIRLMKNGKAKYIATKFSAFQDEWDDGAQTPNRKLQNSARIAHILRKKIVEIDEVIFELESIGDPYSVEEVVNKLSGQGGKKKVIEYYRELADRFEQQGRTGNARVYGDCLAAFQKFAENRDWSFEELNYHKLKKYEEYEIIKGNSINTVATKLRTLRAVYNYAIKEGLVQEKFYPFKKFKIRTEKTRKRALTEEEIKRIENFKTDNPQLTWARDLFMFSFYCMGMNFKDMAYLKVSDIHQGRIQYQRAKTGRLYNIGIHPKLQTLVEKFATGKSKNDYLLPLITDENNKYQEYRFDLSWFNKLLKRIGEELDLSIPMSSYVSRHSWATVARRKGVPTAYISQGLGHSTERTTQIYLDSFEDAKMDEVNAMVVG